MKLRAAPEMRCSWARTDRLLMAYHDREWGRRPRGDRALFAFVILEGAQAGLSWITILKKRPAYRRAFARFDPAAVARFDAARVARLMQDAGIVRNRLKIAGAVRNARRFLEVQKEFGSFGGYLEELCADFARQNPRDPSCRREEVAGRRARLALGPTGNRRAKSASGAVWKTRWVRRPRGPSDVPARSALSDALSADLRRRGFTFVGSTICYAFLQAVGIVDDHLARCFRAERSGRGASG